MFNFLYICHSPLLCRHSLFSRTTGVYYVFTLQRSISVGLLLTRYQPCVLAPYGTFRACVTPLYRINVSHSYVCYSPILAVRDQRFTHTCTFMTYGCTRLRELSLLPITRTISRTVSVPTLCSCNGLDICSPFGDDVSCSNMRARHASLPY